MATLTKTTCCGLREFAGLDEFEDVVDALKFVVPLWFSMKSSFMLCGYIPTKVYKGRKFINFIKKNNLGSITEAGIRLDKTTNTRVRLFFWGVDNETLSKWWTANKPPPPEHWLKAGQSVRANSLADVYGYSTTSTGTEWIVESDQTEDLAIRVINILRTRGPLIVRRDAFDLI